MSDAKTIPATCQSLQYVAAKAESNSPLGGVYFSGEYVMATSGEVAAILKQPPECELKETVVKFSSPKQKVISKGIPFDYFEHIGARYIGTQGNLAEQLSGTYPSPVAKFTEPTPRIKLGIDLALLNKVAKAMSLRPNRMVVALSIPVGGLGPVLVASDSSPVVGVVMPVQPELVPIPTDALGEILEG